MGDCLQKNVIIYTKSTLLYTLKYINDNTMKAEDTWYLPYMLYLRTIILVYRLYLSCNIKRNFKMFDKAIIGKIVYESKTNVIGNRFFIYFFSYK